MSLSKHIVCLVFCCVILSCEDEATQKKPEVTITKEQSADFNKQLIKELNFTINDYIKRNGWQTNTTPTGIRYMVYEEGKGIKAESGMIALIEFDVYLLDGTKCYSSKDEGIKQFKIEQSDVESGLHEAVQYMKVGDRAKVILPHYRAHGLIGDSKKIPPLSPIVYDVYLKALSQY
ncbi:MAG: FKBP-type peptidyl-prolyl cis-trans isomerase [Bacteroidia bacterium]